MKMKFYIKAAMLFLVVYIVGILLRVGLQSFIKEPYLNISFNTFLLISFTLAIIIVGKNKWKLFKTIKIKPYYLRLFFILIVLFAINNYVQVLYSDSQYYSETIKSALGIYIIKYIISSTSEEVIYRGFIQKYINENTVNNSSKISNGNIFSTLIFFLSHLGFFTVMDTVFAITSLINVIIYSLIAGYLFDKTKNLLIPIAMHIVINMLHIFIQISY